MPTATHSNAAAGSMRARMRGYATPADSPRRPLHGRPAGGWPHSPGGTPSASTRCRRRATARAASTTRAPAAALPGTCAAAAAAAARLHVPYGILPGGWATVCPAPWPECSARTRTETETTIRPAAVCVGSDPLAGCHVPVQRWHGISPLDRGPTPHPTVQQVILCITCLRAGQLTELNLPTGTSAS